jgi:hypothetical protein
LGRRGIRKSQPEVKSGEERKGRGRERRVGGVGEEAERQAEKKD